MSANIKLCAETANDDGMDLWESVWWRGVAPLLSSNSLEALYHGLMDDASVLLQGVTLQPIPIPPMYSYPVEGGCVLCYCGWKGEGLETVGEVEEFFARMCYESDQLLGESGGIRHFLGWYDTTPRQEMREKLLHVVALELHRRIMQSYYPELYTEEENERIAW